MNDYRVRPGHNVDLSSIDPNATHWIRGGKSTAVEKTAVLLARMAALQEMFYAQHDRKMLIVLQGMDTSGKDGVIRHVIGALNPQGVRVAVFKKPTGEELEHDYLWRVHRQAPGDGDIVVFNRSHYEDVLVVRVHDLVPKQVWRKRYDHINAFEEMLSDDRTSILKFFLHISKEEQRSRLQTRADDPSKFWKFQPGDLTERKLWADYQRAYADALSKTSTDRAPWYIVPANHKWYRDYVVASLIVQSLEAMHLAYPRRAARRVKVT